MTQQPTDAIPLIGIGTGSSNLAPLAGLLQRIGRDDVAVLVVFESGPPPGALELLGRASRLQVQPVDDETPITPGRLFVCPAEKDLTLVDGVLRPVEPRGARRLPIDPCFRSLAAGRAGQTIGVVLGGAGNDGALGLEAIRAADGITLVEAPASSLDPVPGTALEAGGADFTGTADELTCARSSG